ncbi:hypothetical protein YC2023_101573 [Brassica napus]
MGSQVKNCTSHRKSLGVLYDKGINLYHDLNPYRILLFDKCSFQMWTGEMQENMDYKKHGDASFRAKYFDTATEVYPKTLRDAMQAQVASP